MDGSRTARPHLWKVRRLTRIRAFVGVAILGLVLAAALGPLAAGAQTASGFDRVTIADNLFVAAPGSDLLQHNVPNLTVQVGGQTLTADYKGFFERTGGITRWGYPTSEVHVEESGALTQYFQRGVVDFHRRPDLGNIYVLERRLAWDFFGGGAGGSPDLGVERGRLPNNNSGEQSGPWGHKVSNFSVGGVRTGFLTFFDSLGGVDAFGYPKTEARVDTNAPGTVHIASATPGFVRQYFQAAVMEHHPGDASPVKLRLLGDDLRNRKYPGDAWRRFRAFNAAAQAAAGQTLTLEVVEYTPPPTAAPTAAPTRAPTPQAAVTAAPARTPDRIVVGTRDGGIAIFDGATWSRFDVNSSALNTNRVNDVLTDKDGNIWAATDGGVFRLDRTGSGAGFRKANTGNGLGSDDTRALAGLQSGNTLWVAHDDQGATSYDGSDWRRFRPDNTSLPSSDVRDMHVVSESLGRLWFATANGAALFDQNTETWSVYNTGNSGLASNDLTAVDVRGTFWFGTAGNGVSQTQNLVVWETFTTAEGLGHNDVRDILVASDGAVWVATAGGVSRYANGVFTTANTANSGIPSNNVRALAEDSQGRIWAATNAGVSRYDGAAWTSFTKTHGLASNDTTSIAILPAP